MGEVLHVLSLELFNLLLHRVVLLDILLDDALQVLGIVEECLHSTQRVLRMIDQLLALLASLGLDTTDTCCHTALSDDLEEADLTRSLRMDTTTELARGAEANYTDLIAILLAKESDGTEFLGFIKRHLTMLVERNILTNHIINHSFYLAQFFVRYFLEVREVKSQGIRRDEGTLLFHMVSKYLLQCIIEQVGSRVVGSRSIALVCINTGHELSCGILWKLFHDMHRLVVLTLGVDNIDGLSLVADDATVTYLTTHLTIERCIVEH